MADPVFPDEGKIELLKRLLYSDASAEDMTMKLFSNNHTPDPGDTSASYTEATFTGYSAKTLTSSQSGGTWAVPTIVDNKAKSTYGTTPSWTPSSSETLHGWYILGASSGKVYVAQLFDSPIDSADYDTLLVPVTFKDPKSALPPPPPP